MNDITICRGGRAPPAQNMPTPCAGSRWPGEALSLRAQAASTVPCRWRFAPLAPLVGSPPRGTSGAASLPCSRSCLQSRSSPPIPIRNRRGARQPSGPRVRGPQVKTCSSSCSSWLLLLTSRSLRETRGASIDGILGLSDVEIVRVERRRDIRVWARPTKRPVCLYCGHGGLRIKATYERELKHTRQGNQILIVHLAVPKYHCAGCGRYFRHRFSGIRPRYRATETYRLEVFDGHHGGISQSQLTSTPAIGSATIERWYHHFIEQRVSELSGRPCPQ